MRDDTQALIKVERRAQKKHREVLSPGQKGPEQRRSQNACSLAQICEADREPEGEEVEDVEDG